MDIETHLRRVAAGFSSQDGVTSFASTVRRIQDERAQVKARLHFFDSSYVDIQEIVDTTSCYPNRVRYSYQYVRHGSRVFRYDNSPHHRSLATFPHHKHIGPQGSEQISESQCPSHAELFREIGRYLA